MKRHSIESRPDWVAQIEKVGFTYHSEGEPGGEGAKYWDETVCYEFTAAEIDAIEAATNELHRICLLAVDHVVRHPALMERFAIPVAWRSYVAQSWQRRDPHVYGRFDLAYDPGSERAATPRLLEYNADTPTTLLETAVVQWFWLEQKFPDADQFNSLHDKLVARWRVVAGMMPPGAKLHLSSLAGSLEERQTVAYLEDVALQAGLSTCHVLLDRIGWRAADGSFVDLGGDEIRFWFKLYPWEWLVRDEFGPHLLADRVGVVEPAWKMLLSNKAILPILWELFPDHPNLLPASFEPGQVGERWIAKPILAREGQNLTLVVPGEATLRTEGSYGDSPVIYQEAVRLARFAGGNVVLGSWVVGDEAAGMIVREDARPIIVGDSRVVPHFFR
jgi:glutathionylspermidine synthase